MKVADFDFELPRERSPKSRRRLVNASRLLVLRAWNGCRDAHGALRIFPTSWRGGLLVLNDTKVLAAGRRDQADGRPRRGPARRAARRGLVARRLGALLLTARSRSHPGRRDRGYPGLKVVRSCVKDLDAAPVAWSRRIASARTFVSVQHEEVPAPSRREDRKRRRASRTVPRSRTKSRDASRSPPALGRSASREATRSKSATFIVRMTDRRTSRLTLVLGESSPFSVSMTNGKVTESRAPGGSTGTPRVRRCPLPMCSWRSRRPPRSPFKSRVRWE